MSNKNMTQSAIWVGPRLLLSTLQFHHWIGNRPSDVECGFFREIGPTFNVESEISSQVLSEFSPKVQLIEFSVEHNIALFKLQDQYPSRTEYLNPDWLVECDEARERKLEIGRNIACIGYSSKISNEDANGVMQRTWRQFQGTWLQFTKMVNEMDLGKVKSSLMKAFAPGSLEKIETYKNIIRFGVSASLWKGSGGGPCILLTGTEAGAIMGLEWGMEFLSDPYNIVNGFPNGLRDFIKNLQGFLFM